MKFGHPTASLLIAKLHASTRQNSLARAPQEYGRPVRTIYLCRYVADEQLRRRVRRQLNKGESLHALRRDPVLRPPRPRPAPAPRRPSRPGAVPDPGHQRRRAVDHDLPRRRPRPPARRRSPRHRRRRSAPDTRPARPHLLLRHLLLRPRNRTSPRRTPPAPLTGRLRDEPPRGREQIRSALRGLRVARVRVRDEAVECHGGLRDHFPHRRWLHSFELPLCRFCRRGRGADAGGEHAVGKRGELVEHGPPGTPRGH